jgi:hypothetical protein
MGQIVALVSVVLISLLLLNAVVFGISTVYDVTRRETFTNLSETWAKEIDLYSTNQDCIKMLVGNKVDKVCIKLHCKLFVLWRV